MSLYYKEGAYLPSGFYIGNLLIMFYAICIVTGIVVAVVMGCREAKRLGIDYNFILDGVLIIVPLSILGARLYYVLIDNMQHPTYYNWDISKILDFRGGGLAIHGGIIVAAVSAIIYCLVRRLDFWKIFDLIAPGFLIAQVIGRWGNFFNREVYGGIVGGDNPLGFLPTFIREQMFINDYYRHPLFLYEGLWNLAMFIVFMIIRRHKVLKVGDFMPIYLIWYGIGRAWLEPLRDQSFILSNTSGGMQSVITSVILIIMGVLILLYKYIMKRDLPFYYDALLANNKKAKDENLKSIINDVINNDEKDENDD